MSNPIFVNMSASANTSANASILPPDSADVEHRNGFMNGGRGTCLVDINNDGLDDIYVVGPGKNQMFLNKGNFSFTDITDSAGVGDTGYGMGCASGDLNNDGYQDIIATNYYSHFIIYRNNGNNTFTNMTNTSGVDNIGPQTGVALADFDGDGLLDFFLTEYVKTPDRVYRNLGNFTFEDKTNTSHITDLDFGFQPIVADYNNDGAPDVYVVNDFGLDTLWQNIGNFVFADVSRISGANDARGGMGGAWGDYNNDGALDIYVGNYDNNGLWVNQNGNFHDVGNESGVDDAWTTWGVVWLDYNNDGLMDIYAANGNVEVGRDWYQPNKLFLNNGDGNFTDVSTGSGADTPEVSRGVAAGDLNNDGMVDLYVTNMNCPNMLFKNTLANDNSWLRVHLQGTVSNRDGVGAKVEIVAGTTHETQVVSAGSSYLSSNSKTLSFGLKNHTMVSELIIKWPSGLTQVVKNVNANQTVTVVETDSEDPVARASDVSAIQGEAFEMDGTASTDNVRVASWNWTVTVNATVMTAEGGTPHLTVYTPGTFQGRLDVRDTFNRLGSAWFNVTVSPLARVTVDAGPDLVVPEGTLVSFEAVGSSSVTPAYEGDCTFIWTFTDWSGPVSLSGARPTYLFDRPGFHIITVTVVDPQNATATDRLNVTVLDAQAPRLVAQVPTEVDEDAVVTLDASGTTDNDPDFASTGTITWVYDSYAGKVSWTGARVEVQFPDPGVFTLTLLALDATGNLASRNFTLHVRDLTPPSVNAGPDLTVRPGQEISLSGAASTDNDPSFLSTGTFNWTVEEFGGPVHLTGLQPIVSFSDPGVYRVELDAWDAAGNHAVAKDTMYVRVLDDIKPTANAGGDRTVEVGASFWLDGSLSTDNDPSLLSTGAFVWEFQDGAARQALSGLRAEYTFARAGTYSVRLTVTDQSGNSGAAVFKVDAVDREAPVLSVAAIPANITAGDVLELNASATTDNAGAVTITWRVEGPSGQDTRYFGPTAQAVFAVAGTYAVIVTATDLSGNAATARYIVTVSGAEPAGAGGGGGTPAGGVGAGGAGGPGPGPQPTSAAGAGPQNSPVGALLLGAAAVAVVTVWALARRRSP